MVCHSPAWVKDIQINRQLSSIIQVFSHLESLLKPTEQPGKQELSSHVEPKQHTVLRKFPHLSHLATFLVYQVGQKVTQLVFLSNLCLTADLLF